MNSLSILIKKSSKYGSCRLYTSISLRSTRCELYGEPVVAALQIELTNKLLKDLKSLEKLQMEDTGFRRMRDHLLDQETPLQKSEFRIIDVCSYQHEIFLH